MFLVTSSLFSTHSKRLLYHLVSSSFLYSFKASSLPSCPLFSFLLIKAFFLYLLVLSSLLFSTQSKLLLYLLVPPSLLFPTHSRLLFYLLVPLLFSYHSRFLHSPSCPPSFLLSFKVSSLPSCPELFSTHSRLLLYLLVPLLFSYHSRFLLYLLVPITLICISFLFVASRSCFILFFQV